MLLRLPPLVYVLFLLVNRLLFAVARRPGLPPLPAALRRLRTAQSVRCLPGRRSRATALEPPGRRVPVVAVLWWV